MTFLESPAISDGIVAWKAWRKDLQARASTSRDQAVRADLARAEAVIKMFEQYPNGVDPESATFRKVAREYARMLLTR